MWLVQLLFDELDTCVWPCCYNFEHKVSFILNSNHSLLNLKLFVLLKNCQCKSEIIELASAIVWNRSAIKFAELNLGYDGKMVDHISNSTFVLKLVSRSFCVQKCILRPAFVPSCLLWTLRKVVKGYLCYKTIFCCKVVFDV